MLTFTMVKDPCWVILNGEEDLGREELSCKTSQTQATA